MYILHVNKTNLNCFKFNYNEHKTNDYINFVIYIQFIW